MQTRELRVDNYVIADGKQIQVETVGEWGINFNGFYDGISPDFKPDEVYPISLTEEWFLRLGFEKGSDIMGECWFIENATYDLDFAIHVCDDIFVWHTNDVHVKYVHQLQNLFYAVTNLELETIK